MITHQQFRKLKQTFGLAVFLGTCSLATICVAPSNSKAQGLLTYYNFNDQTTSGAAANTATLTSDSPGQQTTTISTTFVASNLVVFAGTTVNRAAGDTSAAGMSLALQNGSSNINNGKYIQFTVNATGAIGTDNSLTLSYATQRSSTAAFISETLSYSTDGTTFTNFGSLTSIPTTSTFSAQSFALPVFDNTVDLSNLTIRFTFDGASGTSASPNTRLDNIQLSEVPEPTTLFSGMLLVGALGWNQRRWLNVLAGWMRIARATA